MAGSRGSHETGRAMSLFLSRPGEQFPAKQPSGEIFKPGVLLRKCAVMFICRQSKRHIITHDNVCCRCKTVLSSILQQLLQNLGAATVLVVERCRMWSTTTGHDRLSLPEGQGRASVEDGGRRG